MSWLIVSLITVIIAGIWLYRRTNGKHKRVAFAYRYAFVEDEQGCIIRKSATFMNIVVVVILMPIAIGPMIGVILTVIDKNWEGILAMLTITMLVMFSPFGSILLHLIQAFRAPLLIFDIPKRKIIFNGEHIAFYHIKRFEIKYVESSGLGFHTAQVVMDHRKPIELDSFGEREQVDVPKRAKKLVAALDKLVR